MDRRYDVHDDAEQRGDGLQEKMCISVCVCVCEC